MKIWRGTVRNHNENMAVEETMKRYSYFEWDGDFIMTKIFKRLRRINEKQKEGIKAIELSKIVYKCVREEYIIKGKDSAVGACS